MTSGESPIDNEVTWVLGASSLQEARQRFQIALLVSSDVAGLRKTVWPLLYGNEGEQLRQVLYLDARPGSIECASCRTGT